MSGYSMIVKETVSPPWGDCGVNSDGGVVGTVDYVGIDPFHKYGRSSVKHLVKHHESTFMDNPKHTVREPLIVKKKISVNTTLILTTLAFIKLVLLFGIY